jgi:hypothetical protein
MMKGIAPKAGRATQTPVVSRNASRILMPLDTPLALAKATKTPVTSVTTPACKNVLHSGSPRARSSAIGANIVAPRTATSRPIT